MFISNFSHRKNTLLFQKTNYKKLFFQINILPKLTKPPKPPKPPKLTKLTKLYFSTNCIVCRLFCRISTSSPANIPRTSFSELSS